MFQNHEVGCDVDNIARLVPNGVSPEKLKTSEDLSIKIGYDVKIDNHEGGVDVDIDFEARLVTDEVGPEKLKTSENLSNKFGFEMNNMDTGLAFDPGMSTGLALSTHGDGPETEYMDTGLAVNPSMSIGLGKTNHENGFGMRSETVQYIPPPPTPGLSSSLADMKLSAEVVECKISKPKPTKQSHPKSHPQSTRKSTDVTIDECICSARCENVNDDIEPGHRACTSLGVGNPEDRSVLGVINIPTGLATEECICSANCTENCMNMNKKDEYALGMKYCPGWDIALPVYHHQEYKPRYSSKTNNIFRVNNEYTNKDILLVQTAATGTVIASTVIPGWKSSQADRPGSEPGAVAVEDQGAQEGHDGRDGHGGDLRGGHIVSNMITSWEQRSAGGGGGEAGGLHVPVGGVGGGGRRVSQEFSVLRGKFCVMEEEGVERDAQLKFVKYQNCSFSSLASISPGPITGRGARRKLLFKQQRISFPVIQREGNSGLAGKLTNRKRG